MRQKMRYLYVEIKKMIGVFPHMLLQAIMLMILIGAIAFCGAKTMEKEPLAVRADIGVVVREDNTMTRLALGYVENLESASQVCHFVQMTEDEGIRSLEDGGIAALIILPEQLVEGIMNGANPSVEVYFPENAGLEAMLLRELTESGAGLLRVAQAQIYGAYDTAVEYGLTERLSVMEGEIDSYNLAFALDRLAVYREETVSATGKLSIIQFYAASGVILFLLLTGMAVYPVVQREPQAFRKQLARQGTGEAWQCFCKWLCGFLCMGLLGLIAWAALKAAGIFAPEMAEKLTSMLAGGRNGSHVGIQVGVVLLIVITAATLIYLIYSLAGSRSGAVLVIFLLSVVMIYLSGGLVPSMFLPKVMQTIGDKLPTAYMIRAVGGILTGYQADTLKQCVIGMCCYAVVFGAVSYWLRRRD
ncbi:MAG: ABC transporter permease [Lachnospiraceae bacterium]|nr:ABC transporter permease [Lachnospiraceae bacterium]